MSRRTPLARCVVIKATVRGGLILVDAPTDLPEGTVLKFVPDAGEEMPQDEIDALNASIATSQEEARAGRLVPAGEVINELRRRREPS